MNKEATYAMLATVSAIMGIMIAGFLLANLLDFSWPNFLSLVGCVIGFWVFSTKAVKHTKHKNPMTK